MDAPLSTALFGFTGVLYGLLAPLVLLLMLVLMLIPSLLVPGAASPKAISNAIFSHLLQAVAILFMTGGSLPTIVSVLGGQPFSGSDYVALLLLFAVGGLLFLWQDDKINRMDEAARRVPAVIFRTLYKIVGHLVVIAWGISFLMTLVTGLPADGSWWVMPVVMIIYGSVFLWCTKEPNDPGAASLFRSFTMHRTATARSTAPKPVSSKKTVKK